MKALKVILTIILVVLLLATILFNIKNIMDYLITEKIATQAEYEIESTFAYYKASGYHIAVVPCSRNYTEIELHEGSKYYLVYVTCDYSTYGYNYEQTFLAEYNNGIVIFREI